MVLKRRWVPALRRNTSRTMLRIAEAAPRPEHETTSTLPINSRVPPGQAQPRLDLGDAGPTHGNPVRRRSVEFDHRAVALLAHEGDMRDRHDMAAMHPEKQPGIELGLGLRDRPRTHPLAGAVMHLGIMCVSADA